MSLEHGRHELPKPESLEAANQEELVKLKQFYQDLLSIRAKVQGPIKTEYEKQIKSQKTLEKYPTSMSNFRDLRAKRNVVNETLVSSSLTSTLTRHQNDQFPEFEKFCKSKGIHASELLNLEPLAKNEITGTTEQSFNLPNYLERLSSAINVINFYLRAAGVLTPLIKRKSKHPQSAEQPRQTDLDFEDYEKFPIDDEGD